MPTLDVISVNIWQILISLCNLLILFLLLKKFLYKPVRRLLDARQAEIDKRYDDADRAKAEAQELRKAYSDRMAGVDEECDRLIKTAQTNARRRENEIVAEAEERAAGMLRAADAEIELEKRKAASDMKREIADVSVRLTEKMLNRELNEKDQRGIIDSLLDEMGDGDD